MISVLHTSTTAS